ncbi:16S rRNA (uracil(1498)-N(3))-methyltransferase [Chlamydiales bacterium]|nr:16S rRNA (uracil(1498)-N(3))-methyltransferase [Chlamydiales bacterium]
MRHYAPELLKTNKEITLSLEESRHALTVLRKKEGDSIDIINGLGEYGVGNIVKIQKKQVLLKITSLKKEAKPSPKITLANAITHSSKLDLVIEKGTELGADRFFLFPAELSEKNLIKPTHLERLKKITISAMKQSGRLYLPEIVLMPPLKKWSPPDGRGFYGATIPKAPPITSPIPKEALFFVGPEKGFSKEELALLNIWKMKGVSLSQNILRTETASIAALAILLSA